MIPKIVFHPGVFLREELTARSKKCEHCGRTSRYTVQRLAHESGVSLSLMSLILKGKRNITMENCIGIGRALGTSAEMWYMMQKEYDLYSAAKEIEELKERAAQKNI